MNPAELATEIRAALRGEYPEDLSHQARTWIDSMYRGHGDQYFNRLEHRFTEEFLRRCGLADAEISRALGALHP